MDVGVHRVTKKQPRLKLSLCLPFCSRARAQTGPETQAGSGCPELPVRCCLQLGNQWLWDREDQPRAPSGPHTPFSVQATCSSTYWGFLEAPADHAACTGILASGLPIHAQRPCFQGHPPKASLHVASPWVEPQGGWGRRPARRCGLQGSQRSGTSESDHLTRLQGLAQTCLPCV